MGAFSQGPSYASVSILEYSTGPQAFDSLHAVVLTEV